ncbi:MAG: gamma-glutamyl-gamma-aminobutyrate hydrolase family protein [Anaerolineaceae bacterium]|nr:gamma-glutamyl-gamma-aminobutyrate hydrolase family protein [Anaerolineaceae bacterium]
MALPHIGITTSFTNGKQMVDHAYVQAVVAAGGLPLIVPMLESGSALADFVELLDGLIITGGPAITQNMIGALPDDLPPTDPVRTQADEAIYAAMRDRPVFGICYGMQFINAQSGGIIYSDIQAHKPRAIIHSASRGGHDHEVQLERDSRIAKLFHGENLLVNSYHIQAVAEVGKGMRAVGFGPDGVIEAIESEDGRLMGVQFHPERMDEQGKPLFQDFVEQCRVWRERRSG